MDTVVKKLLKALALAFQYTLNFLGDGFLSLLDNLDPHNAFDSKLGRETDIANRFNKGLVISRHRKITRKASMEGILVLGTTSSGKTSTILIPSIMELSDCSIICNDVSGEIRQNVAGFKQATHLIKTINFSNASESCGINFLEEITSSSDVNRIAHQFAYAHQKEGSNSEPYWQIMSEKLIATMIRIALYQAEEVRNMYNVLHLLKLFSAETSKVNRLVINTGDKKLLLDYKSILKTPEKTLQSCISSAIASLSMFENEQIARVTSKSTFKLESLRTTPTILFLQTDVASMKYNSILNGLLLDMLYSKFLHKLPSKTDKDLFFILEECATMNIPGLSTYVSNGRKYQISTTAVIQSISQLKVQYGENANTIIENLRIKIYLAGLTSPSLLKELEEISGKTLHKDKKTGTERVVPLLSTERIRLLPKNRSLIVAPNLPLIMGRLLPFYKNPKYKKLVKIPPPPLDGDIPNGELPVIDLVIKKERKENEKSEK